MGIQKENYSMEWLDIVRMSITGTSRSDGGNLKKLYSKERKQRRAQRAKKEAIRKL